MEIPEPRWRITEMTLENVEETARLEQLCFSTPWSLDSLVEELSNPIAVFLVAMEGNEALGYVGMHHIIDEGYITNICVAPGHRRCGIARSLIQALIDYADEHELQMITLEVRPSNVAALALYEEMGFEKAGSRRDYYQNPREDALILTREC